MTHEEIAEYLRFLDKVMTYRIDTAPEATLFLDGKQVATIDPQVFLAKMYVDRTGHGLETNLIKHMLDTGPVACVAGPRGSGKTSMLWFAKARVEADHPEIRVELLDLKLLADARYFQQMDDEMVVPEFRYFVREELLARLFPGADARGFFAWAFAGPPDGSEHFDARVVRDLNDLSVIVQGYAGVQDIPMRKERREGLLHWLTDNQTSFSHLFEDYRHYFRAAHVLQAAMVLQPWTKLVLIYDNLDRLFARHQPVLLGAINDSHNALASTCRTLVAIRQENIRGEVNRAGDGGDVIEVFLPDHDRYPCMLLPFHRPDHVEAVLHKRQDFADPFLLEKWSDNELEGLEALHREVVGEFIASALHELTNDSIRSIATAYTEFLRYIVLLEKEQLVRRDELFVLRDRGEKQLRTLFFLWLFSEGPKHGVDLLDTIKLSRRQSDDDTIRDIAAKQHLLVTCVLNLTAERGKAREQTVAPRFAEVFARMKMLGLTLSDMHDVLNELCGEPGEQPRSLEFYQTEVAIDSLTEQSSDRLRATQAGKALLTEVSNMVGFIWGRAYCHKYGTPHGPESYHKMSKGTRVRVVYEYLEDLARAHLRMMCLIRRELHPIYGEKWLHEYAQMFGVRGQLQVQRIVLAAIKFYANAYKGVEHPFEIFRAAYEELLQAVDRDGEWQESGQVSLHRGWKFIDSASAAREAL